jgi:hypothetical protein
MPYDWFDNCLLCNTRIQIKDKYIKIIYYPKWNSMFTNKIPNITKYFCSDCMKRIGFDLIKNDCFGHSDNVKNNLTIEVKFIHCESIKQNFYFCENHFEKIIGKVFVDYIVSIERNKKRDSIV